MNKVIQELNGERATRKMPDFNPGDTVAGGPAGFDQVLDATSTDTLNLGFTSGMS